MATPQEILDFKRRSGGGTPNAILEMPKLSKFLTSSNPTRQKQFETLDIALDKWRKTLTAQDAVTQAIAEVNALLLVADGKTGTDGKDGKDGKDGLNGKDGKDGKDGAGINDIDLRSLLLLNCVGL